MARRVHRREITKILQVDRRFHNVPERQSGGIENGQDVPHDLSCLRGRVAVDHAATGGIDRNLTRDEQQIAALHGLAVRTDGLRGFTRRDRDAIGHSKGYRRGRGRHRPAVAGGA
jgi:hypothetical protein